MPLSKPVSLDPFQRIVNVGWGGVDILVLEFSYERNGPRPAFPLHDLPFTATAYDGFDEVIINGDGTGNPTPQNPITDDMLRYLRLWNRPPVFHSFEGSATSGQAILFFNLRKIRQTLPEGESLFWFKITTPGTGSGTTLPGAPSYWVWYDFGDPFPGIDPYLFQANISFDSVWGTAAEAEARAAILSDHSSYHVEEYIGPDTTVPGTLSWELLATTYRNTRDFPTDSENEPQWNTGDALGGAFESGVGSSADAPLPSYVIDLQIDTRTLAVASNKT